MEEVDRIVLLTLKQIGCNIPDNVSSIKDFTPDVLVEATSKGLSIIDKKKSFDSKLPAEMSSRYRICSGLAKACQEHGFKGELGYHQFLYPSESDSRKLMMWMMEALPKMNKQEEEQATGSGALLQRAIVSELNDRSKQSWVPSFCLPGGIAKTPQNWSYRSRRAHHAFRTAPLSLISGTGDATVKISKEQRRYFEKFAQFSSEQPSIRKEAAPSLIEYNAREFSIHQEWEQEWAKDGLGSGLSKEEYLNKKKQKILSKVSEQVKSAVQKAAREEVDSLEKIIEAFSEKNLDISSRFSNQARFAESEQNPVGETEEDLQKRREEEISNLRQRLQDLNMSISTMEEAMSSYESNIKQLESRLTEEQAKTKDLETVYKLKKRTYDLLDKPDENIANLKKGINASSQKMIELAEQWESKRVPLVNTFRELKDKQADRMAESRKQLEEIKRFREEMKKVAEEGRSKNEFHKQLLEEYEKLPKDAQRSQYTERIMEIVKNIQKQNIEISKVLTDTRVIQKEINMLTDTLNRSYSAADELLFRDAKKDEFSKKSYKLLVSVHETCGELVEMIEETGQVLNSSKELEDKINQLVVDRVTTKLEKIQEDYKQVKKENDEILQKIKKAHLGV